MSETPPRYVSPLRYPGGKARMAPGLGEVYATQFGLMDVEIWWEPFAGGAGAGLTMLDRNLIDELWLTEKHPAIAALWRTILVEGDRLAARVETTTTSMSLWEQSRQIISHITSGQHVDDFEGAFAALVVNRCSRSGMITANVGPIGGKHQTGRYHVGSRWNGHSIAERIRHVHRMAPRIRFDEGDAVGRIGELDGSVGIEDELMLFVDPPYLREGNRLYANGMNADDHQALADALNSCASRWLLTYDNEDTIPDVLYPERRVLAYEIPNTANKVRTATEYAVMSDSLDWSAGMDLLPGRSWWVRNQPV